MRRDFLGGVGFAALLLAATSASAQTVDPETTTIDDVVVVGIRGSLAAAIVQKRQADGFVDTLVAEDIGKFPDLNITEALQRVPGVAINRVQGEGQSITVRSLAPEFTQVRLNGQTVTSAGGRSVELDLFASELFQGVTLIKTPHAALTEGGLAATVDMRTRRPFDREGFSAAGSIKGQYNSMNQEWDPRGSLLISRTWGETFGALVSAAYSNTTLREDAGEVITWEIDRLAGGALPQTEHPFLPRSINEFRQRERLGLTGALQWRPTPGVEVNLDAAYARFDELRSRFTIDALLFDGTPVPVNVQTVPGAGGRNRIVGGSFSNVQSRSENVFDDLSDTLSTVNLDGRWDIGAGWSAYGRIGVSRAEQEADLFRILYQFRGNATFGLTEYQGHTVPTFASTSFSFDDPNAYTFNQLRYLRDFITDDEDSAQFGLIKTFDSGVLKSVRGGVRHADHRYGRIALDQRVNPSSANPAPAFSTISSPNFGLFGGSAPAGLPSRWLVVQREDFDSVQRVVPPDFVPAQSFPATFSVTEKTSAAYVQADIDTLVFGGLPLRGNVGVRAVETDQTSLGYAIVAGVPREIVVGQTYTDVLPSLNLVLEPSQDLLVRFAASRAITRPTISQLSPGFSQIDIAQQRATQGNPDLDPFRVSQYDLGVERYFGNGGLMSATAFYKDVESFITTTTASRQISFGGPVFNDRGVDVSNQTWVVTSPINGTGAIIRGVELTWQQPLDFLPISGFGFLANYTYADSEITRTYGDEPFKAPFTGSSPHSYNLVGYYENGPISARFAYAWRDTWLESARGNTETSNFNEAYGQLDFSASYAVTDTVKVTLDALNLTNEVVSRYGVTEDRPIGVYQAGRFVFVGAQFSF